jgi:hypothetical protein
MCSSRSYVHKVMVSFIRASLAPVLLHPLMGIDLYSVTEGTLHGTFCNKSVESAVMEKKIQNQIIQ